MSLRKDITQDISTQSYSKKEFIYECSLRGFQGSLSNPNFQSSIASIVREAEKLWEELQEWEIQEAKRESSNGSTPPE